MFGQLSVHPLQQIVDTVVSLQNVMSFFHSCDAYTFNLIKVWDSISVCAVRIWNTHQVNFAGLLRPLETVSKTSHKFEVNVFNNRKIHKVFAQSRSI